MLKKTNDKLTYKKIGFSCVDCNRYFDMVRTRSHRCSDCALIRLMQEVKEMQQGSGPFFDKWCEGMMRSIKAARERSLPKNK